MTTEPLNTRSTEIRNEACAWVAQLETGNATREDIESFREWVRRSPRHIEEVRRAARCSADLNIFVEFAVPLKEAGAHYSSVVAGDRHRQPTAGQLIAAAIAFMVVVLAVIAVWEPISKRNFGPVALATEIGEHQEVKLPDGSVVSLNTNSRLEVDYTAGQRTVWLLQGEALFEVASNPKRPFVVYAGRNAIEAVGTAFVVRFDRTAFEVAVTEGTVRVRDVVKDGVLLESENLSSNQANEQAVAAKDGGEASAPLSSTISASQDIVLKARQTWRDFDGTYDRVYTISDQELRRKLAWREGLLDFSDTPLEKVIREVSRHTTLTIKIVDPSLRELKFGGLFRTGDTKPLFTALETNYGITVEYLDNGSVNPSRRIEGKNL